MVRAIKFSEKEYIKDLISIILILKRASHGMGTHNVAWCANEKMHLMGDIQIRKQGKGKRRMATDSPMWPSCRKHLFFCNPHTIIFSPKKKKKKHTHTK